MKNSIIKYDTLEFWEISNKYYYILLSKTKNKEELKKLVNYFELIWKHTKGNRYLQSIKIYFILEYLEKIYNCDYFELKAEIKIYLKNFLIRENKKMDNSNKSWYIFTFANYIIGNIDYFIELIENEKQNLKVSNQKDKNEFIIDFLKEGINSNLDLFLLSNIKELSIYLNIYFYNELINKKNNLIRLININVKLRENYQLLELSSILDFYSLYHKKTAEF